jgi:hypothetical protein
MFELTREGQRERRFRRSNNGATQDNKEPDLRRLGDNTSHKPRASGFEGLQGLQKSATKPAASELSLEILMLPRHATYEGNYFCHSA